MNLKAELDEYRAGALTRFNEQQRETMGRFQKNVASAKRSAPKVGDVLSPFSLMGTEGLVTSDALLGHRERLALVFFRGKW